MPGAMPSSVTSSTDSLTPLSSYDSVSAGWQTPDAEVDDFDIRSSGPWSRNEFARRVLAIETTLGDGPALGFIANHFPHITSKNAQLWLAYMKNVRMMGVGFDRYIMDTFRQIDWYAILSTGAVEDFMPELGPLFLAMGASAHEATSVGASDTHSDVELNQAYGGDPEESSRASTPQGPRHEGTEQRAEGMRESGGSEPAHAAHLPAGISAPTSECGLEETEAIDFPCPIAGNTTSIDSTFESKIKAAVEPTMHPGPRIVNIVFGNVKVKKFAIEQWDEAPHADDIRGEKHLWSASVPRQIRRPLAKV
ncbi:hypothetical protein AURDEDRAFT_130077 [Auricularia subglabra TFB-10046 SS5]|uniref:Uncharacterized protein n=1 Tax=Auricularia subglabra (strain TFB-10046 / SS5) TaxID=717982 RepID=J0CYM8_AURST|nr:hypothetical protein AURDEDRAFT_130077 [Auricularia subglabra TFB-10046 SS5]